MMKKIEQFNHAWCVINTITFGSMYLTREQAINMYDVFLQASDHLEEYGEFEKVNDIRNIKNELHEYIMKVR